jgi:serine phosphatase RsbU (regulator of sigma subunit)
VRGNGTRDLWEGGPPLGLLEHADYREERLTLATDDVCILMTDGITESFDSLSTSLASVVASLASQCPRSAGRICDAMMARAVEGSGPSGVEDWTDDRTVVVVTVVRRLSPA